MGIVRDGSGICFRHSTSASVKSSLLWMKMKKSGVGNSEGDCREERLTERSKRLRRLLGRLGDSSRFLC